MSGKYGPVDVKIEIDDSPGGSLQDMTTQVKSINGLKLEEMNEEDSAFSQLSELFTPIGKQKALTIVVKGDFDSTASTGAHVVFGTPDIDPQGDTRTFKVTVGDNKYLSVEMRLKDYEIELDGAKLQAYTATFVTGDGTARAAWA